MYSNPKSGCIHRPGAPFVELAQTWSTELASVKVSTPEEQRPDAYSVITETVDAHGHGCAEKSPGEEQDRGDQEQHWLAETTAKRHTDRPADERARDQRAPEPGERSVLVDGLVITQCCWRSRLGIPSAMIPYRKVAPQLTQQGEQSCGVLMATSIRASDAHP